ncbi:MAG: hypothetical protein Q9202_007468 [Teloschistes flavicans]
MSQATQASSIETWIDTVIEKTQSQRRKKPQIPLSPKGLEARALNSVSLNPRVPKRKQSDRSARHNPTRACRQRNLMPGTESSSKGPGGNPPGRRGKGTGPNATAVKESRQGRSHGDPVTNEEKATTATQRLRNRPLHQKPTGAGIARELPLRTIVAPKTNAKGSPKKQSPILQSSEDLEAPEYIDDEDGEDIDEQQQPPTEPSVKFDPPSEKNSKPGGRREKSPAKKGKSLDNEKPDADISMADLAKCSPSVHLKTSIQAEAGGPIPPLVTEMYAMLHPYLPGYIPSSLQSSYAVPADSTLASLDAPRQYLPTTADYIPDVLIPSAKCTVDAVVISTENNVLMGVHERQWGYTTAAALFIEVLKWPQNKGAMMVNVSPIEPVQFRMTRRNGRRLDYDTIAKDKGSTVGETETTTTRMIDACLGLNLKQEVRDMIARNWFQHHDYEQSLNQTLSYMTCVPLFADFEFKKKYQVRDPLVQLGIWMAGLFSKRKHHKWDQSMPMPGIVVDGDKWALYIGFARGNGVVSLKISRMSTRYCLLIWAVCRL